LCARWAQSHAAEARFVRQHSVSVEGAAILLRVTWRLIGVALALAACTISPSRTGSARPCVLAAADTARWGAQAVYPECAVDQPARLMNPDEPVAYQPPYLSCITVRLRFVVDALGRPDTTSAYIVSASTPAFGTAVLASLPHWRFAPALRRGKPVRAVLDLTRSLRYQAVPSGDGPTLRLTWVSAC